LKDNVSRRRRVRYDAARFEQQEASMATGNDGNLGVALSAQPAQRAETQSAAIRYVDRPECQEAFADSITQVYFDGQSLRIEFAVTRIDEVKPNTPLTGRRYPVQRMALTPVAAVELINRMQQVARALTQAGVLKPTPQPPG
jgi:hypothetical protein